MPSIFRFTIVCFIFHLFVFQTLYGQSPLERMRTQGVKDHMWRVDIQIKEANKPKVVYKPINYTTTPKLIPNTSAENKTTNPTSTTSAPYISPQDRHIADLVNTYGPFYLMNSGQSMQFLCVTDNAKCGVKTGYLLRLYDPANPFAKKFDGMVATFASWNELKKIWEIYTVSSTKTNGYFTGSISGSGVSIETLKAYSQNVTSLNNQLSALTMYLSGEKSLKQRETEKIEEKKIADSKLYWEYVAKEQATEYKAGLVKHFKNKYGLNKATTIHKTKQTGHFEDEKLIAGLSIYNEDSTLTLGTSYAPYKLEHFNIEFLNEGEVYVRFRYAPFSDKRDEYKYVDINLYKNRVIHYRTDQMHYTIMPNGNIASNTNSSTTNYSHFGRPDFTGWASLFTSNEVYHGGFVNGKKHGLATIYTLDGKLLDCKYINGVRQNNTIKEIKTTAEHQLLNKLIYPNGDELTTIRKQRSYYPRGEMIFNLADGNSLYGYTDYGGMSVGNYLHGVVNLKNEIIIYGYFSLKMGLTYKDGDYKLTDSSKMAFAPIEEFFPFNRIFPVPFVVKFKSNEIYIGELSKNFEMHGRGTYIYNNGDIYIGQFKNNMLHSYGGMMIYKNGDVYQGGFVNDKIEGNGTYIHAAEGEKYSGNFKDGMRDGEGKLEYVDGTTKKVIYKDGVLQE